MLNIVKDMSGIFRYNSKYCQVYNDMFKCKISNVIKNDNMF